MNSEQKLLKELNSLRGLKCLTTKYGSAMLILYLDEMHFRKPRLTKWRLWIDCAWRLETESKIVIGYLDDDKIVLKNLRRLHQKRITGIQYVKKTRDFIVSFEGEIKLRGFVNSVGGEQWELRKSDGYRIGIGKKLKICQKQLEPDSKKKK